ncbi:alpha/beta hydrolase family protein [Lignipirellula cremea]|uniref:Acetyl xylan esterase (AXE1) n=1 Tax=Lignipirellula cremea TaxID=2528010 RepID=A0A518DSP0_9BACT|nr:CocE/NonD family hydrolase [Lignipirellula cremea]QDU94857.1 Acetyl xylan esterase (AXE1) [Lignipirellula cremea]
MRWVGSLTAAVICVSGGFAWGQADRAEIPVRDNPVFQGVQDHINRLCEAHDAKLFALQTEADLIHQMIDARAKFLELLDLDLDKPRQTPPVLQVGRIMCDGYEIEKLIIQSAPGVPIPCTLYRPTGGPAQKPALLVPHGHSGRDRPIYQKAYQRFVKAGFIVLAKDGWGKQERRSTGHETRGGHLFLTGASLMALELFDNVRCIDYLASRADVDDNRIGMTGTSGGGSQTLFCAAVDTRLAAASPTCAATSLRADLADTDMCICELLTDLLTVGDHSTFLAMAYPRSILVVNGVQDYIFPIQGARASVRDARRLYALGKKEDRMRLAEFDAPHSWHDDMVAEQIRFFRQAFEMPPLKEIPSADAFRSYRELQCYPEGDMPADSLTLADLHRQRITSFLTKEKQRQDGPAASSRQDFLTDMIRQRWSQPVASPQNVQQESLGPDRSHFSQQERIHWTSGLGGKVSVLVTTPLDPTMTAAARKQLVVRLHGDGEADRLEKYYWNDRIRTHATVVELTYTGKSLNPHETGQIATALLSSGKSLLAERVRDLLVTLAVVDDLDLVDEGHNLTLLGHGYDGPLLLAAAPLLPENAHLLLDRSQVSYAVGPEVDLETEELGAETAHWTVLPNLARRLDLADLVEIAQPRRITLFHPLDAARQPLATADWQALLPAAQADASARVEVLGADRPRRELFRRLNQIVTFPLAP